MEDLKKIKAMLVAGAMVMSLGMAVFGVVVFAGVLLYLMKFGS